MTTSVTKTSVQDLASSDQWSGATIIQQYWGTTEQTYNTDTTVGTGVTVDDSTQHYDRRSHENVSLLEYLTDSNRGNPLSNDFTSKTSNHGVENKQPDEYSEEFEITSTSNSYISDILHEKTAKGIENPSNSSVPFLVFNDTNAWTQLNGTSGNLISTNETFHGLNLTSPFSFSQTFNVTNHAEETTLEMFNDSATPFGASHNSTHFHQSTLLPKLAERTNGFGELLTSAANVVDEILLPKTSEDRNESWEVYVKVIVLALISLVGSFGNVMVIWSIVKERHLHRPPFYVLLNLGVTDLSRAVFCVPVVITTVLHGSIWRHGDSACKLFAFATSFFVYSSVLSLLAVSIDRHVSTVYSKTYRRRSHGIINLFVVIIIWMFSFCISFPPVAGMGDYVFIPGEAQCAFNHKHYSHNDPAVASVLIFLATLFLAYFLYFRVFKFLRAHRKMRPLQHHPARSATWAFVGQGANGQAFINWLNGFGGQVPARQAGQRQVQRLNFGRVVNLSAAKNEHLTRLFLILTLVFGAMWTPYIVLSLWRIFGDIQEVPSVFVTVAAWLGYGQTAVCPLVYFVVKSRGRTVNKTVYSAADKKEFLLENKIRK